MKIIPVLGSVLLVLVVLAVLGPWTAKTLLPRARPESALERVAATGSPVELRRELRLRGDPNAKDPRGFTVLDWAARTGQAAAIAELVRAGADPDLRDSGPNGWTPLHHAAHKGQLGAVRALLAAGADAAFIEIDSDNGHDAHLGENAQFEAALIGFVDAAAAARGLSLQSGAN